MRAIGVALGGGVAQVSMNVERPLELPLASVVAARRAATPSVGRAPSSSGSRRARRSRASPTDLPIAGFDPGAAT